MKRFFWTCISLLTVCFAFGLRATDISGMISGNTAWGLAGSPYKLVGYTRVNYGATLTVDPGVVVNGNGQKLEIFGTLNAIGSTSQLILFTNLIVAPGTNSTS